MKEYAHLARGFIRDHFVLQGLPHTATQVLNGPSKMIRLAGTLSGEMWRAKYKFRRRESSSHA
jgi:hypothetical protein